jgi:hypothetical protein
MKLSQFIKLKSHQEHYILRQPLIWWLFWLLTSFYYYDLNIHSFDTNKVYPIHLM